MHRRWSRVARLSYGETRLFVGRKFPPRDPPSSSFVVSVAGSFVALCPVIFSGYFVRARRSLYRLAESVRDRRLSGNQAHPTPGEKCLRVYEWQGFSVPG